MIPRTSLARAMPKCTILVPTHRDGRKERITLQSVAHFSSDTIRVMIADNSTLPAKHQYLRELAKTVPGVEIHIHEKNIGGMQNVLYLLEHSRDSEYVALCSDDDTLTMDFVETSLELLHGQPTASGAAGHLVALHSNGTSSFEPAVICGDSATDRIAGWFNPSSFNLLIYSVLRRSDLQPWIEFNRHHPMRSAFFDFLLTTAVAARGPVKRHASGAYIWRADNWDTPGRNFASRCGWYRELGLPESFAIFFDLHFAVEQAVFLLGRHSPVISPQDRAGCAEVTWSRCINRFRQAVAQQEGAYVAAVNGTPRAVDVLRAFYHHDGCPSPELIRHFPVLLAEFSPSLAEAYSQHLDTMLP